MNNLSLIPQTTIPVSDLVYTLPSLTSSTDVDQSCLLGFLGNGECSQNVLNSINYLDLGSALAAFGLIFAVYQLRNAKWDIVLDLREVWERNLFWILGIAGLFFTLLSVLATQLPTDFTSKTFSNPLLYQIISYLFFVASPLSLLYYAQNAKNLFKEKNARRFYEVLIEKVSRSEDETTSAAIEVLLHNFDQICKSATQLPLKSKEKDSALAILEVVLSEESVVKILTTQRLDALQYIFYILEKYNLNRRQGDIGVSALVRNLFLDNKSFLYKQLNRDGLALSSNIYETIFESEVLITNFNFFGYPTLGYSAKDKSPEAVRVFIHAFSKSLEIYWKTGSGSINYLCDGFEYLSNIFGDICLDISIAEEKEIDTKYQMQGEWRVLRDITHFLSHDYIYLAHDEMLCDAVIEAEKTTTEAGFHSHSSVSAAVAATLYKAFEQLSYIDKETDVYHTVLDLIHAVMYEPDHKVGYATAFEKRLWEQIGANVISRHYPSTTRTYLTFLGFCVSSDDDRSGWIGQQAERVRRLLYVDLKPLFENRETMVNDELMEEALLPSSLVYKDGKFYYKSDYGKGSEKEIKAPEEGSVSALEGVELENRRSLL